MMQILFSFLICSLTMILVLTIRPIARHQLGARGTYLLWILVPLACGCVLLPQKSETKILPQAETATPIAANIQPANVTEIDQPTATNATQGTRNIPWHLWPFGAAVAWLVGFVWVLGREVIQHRLFLQQAKLSKNRGRIQQSQSLPPMAYGIISTRIVLPHDFKNNFTAVERRLICAHEKTHLQHGDNFHNVLALFILAINWFNPLAYYSFRIFREDQELACDEAVLTKFSMHRKTYANALLKIQTQTPTTNLGSYWTMTHQSTLKSRIQQIVTPRKSRLNVALSLTAALSVLGLSVAWAAKPTSLILIEAPSHVALEDRELTAEEKAYIEKELARAEAELKKAHAEIAQQEAKLSQYEAQIQDEVRRELEKAKIEVERQQEMLKEQQRAIHLEMQRKYEQESRKSEAEFERNHVYAQKLFVEAAAAEDLSVVKKMVEGGMSANAYVKYDGTALMAAAKTNNKRMAKYLIEQGADVNFGRQPDASPLIEASRHGHLSMVKYLVANGADVNGYVRGDETPLIAAASKGELAIAKYLIAKGADIHARVPSGNNTPNPMRSAIGQAQKYNEDAMVKYLQSQGATLGQPEQ